MYFAWLGLFLFPTNILHVISFCGVFSLWIYRFDDLRYSLVARVLQCFHAVHLLTPDSSLFLLRCLKWPTLSFARGGPCGGHWLGVSMTTWLFRWVCTDLLLLLLLNVSNRGLPGSGLHIKAVTCSALRSTFCSAAGCFQTLSSIMHHLCPSPDWILFPCSLVPLCALTPSSGEMFMWFLTCCSQATVARAELCAHTVPQACLD